MLTFSQAEGNWCDAWRVAVVDTNSLSSEKVYSFHLDLENGEWVRANLLRSVECFGNAAVGDKVYLDMPEQGAVGYATLLSTDDAPAVEEGAGCRITGLFQHSHGTILDVKLAGERDDIGVTPQHPIWSEDRGDWIPAGELQPGERVKTLDGTTIVESLSLRNEPEPFVISNKSCQSQTCLFPL